MHGTLHVAHVCPTLAYACWCVYRDKNKITVIQSLAIASCKMQASCSYITLHQFFQSGLIDGEDALPQQVNFRLHNINTRHTVSHVGKAGTRYQAHITCANYADCCHTMYTSLL